MRGRGSERYRNGFVPLAVAATATATAWAASEVVALRRVAELLERRGQAPVPEPTARLWGAERLTFFAERGICADQPPAA